MLCDALITRPSDPVGLLIATVVFGGGINYIAALELALWTAIKYPESWAETAADWYAKVAEWFVLLCPGFLPSLLFVVGMIHAGSYAIGIQPPANIWSNPWLAGATFLLAVLLVVGSYEGMTAYDKKKQARARQKSKAQR